MEQSNSTTAAESSQTPQELDDARSMASVLSLNVIKTRLLKKSQHTLAQPRTKPDLGGMLLFSDPTNTRLVFSVPIDVQTVASHHDGSQCFMGDYGRAAQDDE